MTLPALGHAHHDTRELVIEPARRRCPRGDVVGAQTEETATVVGEASYDVALGQHTLDATVVPEHHEAADPGGGHPVERHRYGRIGPDRLHVVALLVEDGRYLHGCTSVR
jgi:hypothetical protein